MSNPAVEVDDRTSPTQNVAAASPLVTFVSGFDNEDDNLIQQTAADDDDTDNDDVNEEVPLVAAADPESVCFLSTVCLLCLLCFWCM